MKQFFKMMMVFLIVGTLLLGMTACKDENKKVDEADQADTPTTTTEEGDPTYNVEEDLVEGILTDEMLDEMTEEEEASTEGEEETKEEEKATPRKYYIKVNRSTNVVTIYTYDDAGNYTVPVKAMRCSTGSATPVGTFKLSSKHRWQLMFGGSYAQYCSRITGHFLFHSVTYTAPQSDALLYGLYNQLGNTVSAGCIRLTAGDAYWMYNNCGSGTVVELFNGTSADDPLGKPTTAIIPESSPYKTWDPTDPVENNPWNNVGPTIEASDKTIELGTSFDPLADVSVVDVYGQTITPDVSGSVNTKKAGTYKIEYSATDSKGKSDSTSITVTVEDTTAPVIKHKLSDKKYTGDRTDDAIETYVKKHITVTDASGEPKVSVKSSVNEKSGKISCTITATDKSGNEEKDSFKMTFDVPDTTAPTIKHKLNNKTYKGSRTEADVKAYVLSKVTAKDDESTPTVDVTVAIDTAAGKISCTVVAADEAGNKATDSFEMLIDVTAPTITSSPDGTEYTGECSKGAVEAYVKGSVKTDEKATLTIRSTAIDIQGKKIVCVVAATDEAGNTSGDLTITMTLESNPPTITNNVGTDYTGNLTEADVQNYLNEKSNPPAMLGRIV